MAHCNGPVKSEPIEEGGVIDVMDSQMLSVIDEADACLNRLQNRSRNFAENAGGRAAGFYSFNGSMYQWQSDSLLFSPIDRRSSSSGSVAVSSDNSTNSEDTVLYSHDASVAGIAEPSSPIVIADDSLLPGAGAIRSTRGHRRMLLHEAANTSVIDLTNVPLPTPTFGADHVVIVSSDEEDNVDRVYPETNRNTSVLSLEMPISIEINDSPVNRREQVLTSEQHPLRSFNNNTQRRRALAAVAHSSPQSGTEPPPPKVATSSSSEIICPICYEPLANRPAMSTNCGHLFCAECLKQSLKYAKKCPVCKKTLTGRSQMHPVYLSTM
uniref:RING-type domain-containing protein n=1 Tax=Anopheles dirus TaxID=7168 RepID=A0A182NHW7_9DIPT